MKKTFLTSALVAIVGVGLTATVSFATPVINGSALQNLFDGFTVGGSSSVDVKTDMLDDAYDSVWSITGSGASAATLILNAGSYAPNTTFGVYSGSSYVGLFGPGSNSAGNQAFLSIKLDGSVYVNNVDTTLNFAGNSFGYYIDSSSYGGGGLFHSDTSLNTDQVDHMAAYVGENVDTIQLPNVLPGLWTNNEYALAFEDIYGGGDRNYTDFVVMVESVQPVPEPATMLLFGAGLAGLAGVSRRRK